MAFVIAQISRSPCFISTKDKLEGFPAEETVVALDHAPCAFPSFRAGVNTEEGARGRPAGSSERLGKRPG